MEPREHGDVPQGTPMRTVGRGVARGVSPCVSTTDSWCARRAVSISPRIHQYRVVSVTYPVPQPPVSHRPLTQRAPDREMPSILVDGRRKGARHVERSVDRTQLIVGSAP